MQLFPAPAAEDFALWPDRDDDSTRSALPFRCFVHRFEDGFPPVDTLTDIYQTLLRQAENAVGRPAKREGEAIPHNVVLDRKWIMVTPRRTAGLNGAVANAAAMLGMVWVANEEMLKLWTELGPANVLAHVGIPADVK
jgi:ATP adenylyltransferase